MIRRSRVVVAVLALFALLLTGVAYAESSAFARITGGGWRVIGSNGESVRSGFTLHCDTLLSNNLQINWNQGQTWHIDKLVDGAFCEDDPDFTPEPPVAPADTYVGVDVGKA